MVPRHQCLNPNTYAYTLRADSAGLCPVYRSAEYACWTGFTALKWWRAWPVMTALLVIGAGRSLQRDDFCFYVYRCDFVMRVFLLQNFVVRSRNKQLWAAPAYCFLFVVCVSASASLLATSIPYLRAGKVIFQLKDFGHIHADKPRIPSTSWIFSLGRIDADDVSSALRRRLFTNTKKICYTTA